MASSKVAARLKAEKAKARREKREAKQARRQQGLLPRDIDVRELRHRLLIVCEGARTEPNYFRCFKVNAEVAQFTVAGEGRNTLSLVRQAIDLRERDGPFTEVWAVFDRDSFPLDHFNEAIRLAHAEGLRAAWSNEAFELWYLLHFEYCDTNLSRSTYGQRLDRYLSAPYAKNSETMFGALESKQIHAIENAARLLESHGLEALPHEAAPATTVHHLVDRLRDLSV